MSVKKAVNSIESLYDRYKDRQPVGGGEEDMGRLKSPFVSFDRYVGGGPGIGKLTTYSAESSVGKTSLALAIAGYNKDKSIGFLDQEYEWTEASYKWVKDYFGIERDRISVLQPRYTEEAAQMVSDMCNFLDIIIIDGVTSIGPKAEYEDDMESYKMGLDARILNKALRKIRGKIYDTGTTILATNKVYSNISGYGDPLTEPGGRGITYYPAQRFRITKSKNKDSSGEYLGHKMNITVIKDKITGADQAKFSLYYNKQEGFDVITDLINNCVDYGIIEKAGSWYSYDGNKIGQGAAKVKQFLYDNEGLTEELYSNVLSKIEL